MSVPITDLSLRSVHLYNEGKPDAFECVCTHVSFAALVRFVMVVAKKVSIALPAMSPR